jgi:hypothetical protein
VSLDLTHLDSSTRGYMIAELNADLGNGTLYRSPQLSEEGLQVYSQLLRAALLTGTDASFAVALSANNAIRPLGRWQHSKEIGATDALASATAILAEREFHRFYIRGLCCRALKHGIDVLVIYRARPADHGRTPADSMIGLRIDVRSLLEDLRGAFRSLPPHGLPQCRDPGLSVRFPDECLPPGADAEAALHVAIRL